MSKRKYKPKDHVWLYQNSLTFGKRLDFYLLPKKELIKLQKSLQKYIEYWDLK